jgi:flagellar hook-associated protein 3 FlgL
MRISTSAIYDANVSMLNQQQAKLLHTQQQLASGRRMLTASDDPIASARALEVSQSDAMNTQYETNRKSATSSYSLADGALQSVADLLLYVRTRSIEAGGALTASMRQSMATDLNARIQELQGLANSTDGQGNYLFSGFQGKTQPFTNAPGTVQFNGDDGQRMIQVSGSRQLAATDSGADIFMRIKSFATQVAAGNTGSGIISQGIVTNAALINGNSYQVSFTGAATYDVIQTTPAPATSLSIGNAYTSGQAITVGGMQFSIAGIPAAGDTFSATAVNESIFKTISDLSNALASGTATPAQIADSVSRAINMLDHDLDKVLMVRASLGSRMNEVDSLQVAGTDLGLNFKATLSQLQDVDYNKGVSDLSMQQLSLQAAQQSFKKVSDLSLFNYL